ncbi:MAG: leucine-rich repeat protein [Bacteroidaceae bacterium]|nr:leucine-rich repeat protein [Bacteroidaceae bacterium]
MKANVLQAKKILMILFVMLSPLFSNAQTKVEIDGIWYKLNTEANQAEVTLGDTRYSGSITIPTTVTHKGVDYSVTSIGEYAFSCSSLTSITIPKSVVSIGDGSFWSCSSLTAITIPESVTIIGNEAFRYCSSLTSITIPEGVTSIGDDAFYGCSSLKEVTFGKGLKEIAVRSFDGSSAIEKITVHATRPPVSDGNIFSDETYKNATLYVPQGCVTKYEVATGWSRFYNIVESGAAITRITLDQTSATLSEGETLTITATVVPDDAADKSISWSSSNPSVATVDNTGKVDAVAPGTATVTATAADGSGVSASCKVTVVDKQYTVTFMIDDVVVATYSLKRGDPIVAPKAPEREGYTFSGWGKVPETMPAENVTYYGSYTINSYTLTYMVDGEIYATEQVVYGSTPTAMPTPTKEGYTFSGWSEVPEMMPASNVTVTGSFSINTYVVTFMVDGVVVSSKTLEYGAAITVPTMPEREGYTFSGWNDVDATVPAGDVTYHATYTANTYNVYYFVGATLVHIAEVAYGETIPEYIYVPTAEGDVFMGWIGEAYDTMPAHDVTYTANIYNGIGQLTIDKSQLTIYDLTGRKVTDTENLKGGIYIINGRKVVIK